MLLGLLLLYPRAARSSGVPVPTEGGGCGGVSETRQRGHRLLEESEDVAPASKEGGVARVADVRDVLSAELEREFDAFLHRLEVEFVRRYAGDQPPRFDDVAVSTVVFAFFK